MAVLSLTDFGFIYSFGLSFFSWNLMIDLLHLILNFNLYILNSSPCKINMLAWSKMRIPFPLITLICLSSSGPYAFVYCVFIVISIYNKACPFLFFIPFLDIVKFTFPFNIKIIQLILTFWKSPIRLKMLLRSLDLIIY